MQYTEEQIKQKYKSLSNEVKEAITSVDTTKKIVYISEKYKIPIDGVGELVDETGLVMLGLTNSKDFVSHVKKRLEISEDLARVLVKEINDDVLINIRESLKKIQEREIIQERAKTKKTEDTEGLDNKIINNQQNINHIIEPKLELKKDEGFLNKEKDLYSDLNKDQIIKELEDPLGVKEDGEKYQEIIKSLETSLSEVKKTEIIERSSGGVEETTIKKDQKPIAEQQTVEENKISQQTPEKKVIDPYRESID